MWAHPRSRGENDASQVTQTTGPGSSPLTRGKPRPSRPLLRPCGLIPAHAGKTRPELRRPTGSRAHPRSRGENGASPSSATSGEGSSPLTRGKLPHAPSIVLVEGLIPAHAGKTPSGGPGSLSTTAHPRSRGENTRANRRVSANLGSSPLTRGKLRVMQDIFDLLGLIPAHAGKTLPIRMGTSRFRAHPRSRGENIRPIGFASIAAGSSPLTRGKLLQHQREPWRDGLIPAHAGKTWPSYRPPSPTRAHPRSRGENAIDVDPTDVDDGSSPLTRGKHRGLLPVLQGHGLIPAHAGKT